MTKRHSRTYHNSNAAKHLRCLRTIKEDEEEQAEKALASTEGLEVKPSFFEQYARTDKGKMMMELKEVVLLSILLSLAIDSSKLGPDPCADVETKLPFRCADGSLVAAEWRSQTIHFATSRLYSFCLRRCLRSSPLGWKNDISFLKKQVDLNAKQHHHRSKRAMLYFHFFDIFMSQQPSNPPLIPQSSSYFVTTAAAAARGVAH